MAVEALQAHKEWQGEERLPAGGQLSDHDLVFSTRTGGALDAANVRREFKAACKAAGIGEHWTPRELRHSFVSLCPARGCRSRRSHGSPGTPTPGRPRWSTGGSYGLY